MGEISQVAQTIYEQFGGRFAMVMIGGKDIVADGNSIMFRFMAGAKNKATKVVIKLDPSDTYTVTFLRKKKYEMVTVAEFNDVYADSLKTTFESATGLYLSL